MSEPVCFTVTARGKYVNGSSEYVLDGDYITTSVEEDDLFGARMFFYNIAGIGKLTMFSLGSKDSLDLSFIGWDLLGICTLGIVQIFWTEPYHESANAGFYLNLLSGTNQD